MKYTTSIPPSLPLPQPFLRGSYGREEPMQGNGALHFILESIKGVLLSAAKCPFELASEGHPSDLLEKIQAIFLNMTTFLGRFPGAANALVLMGITQTLDVASSHFQGMASNPKFNLRWIASLAYHFSQAKENLLVRVRSLAPPFPRGAPRVSPNPAFEYLCPCIWSFPPDAEWPSDGSVSPVLGEATKSIKAF